MIQENGSPDLKVFSTGATRTRDADGERYDLITPIGLEGVARIYAEGAAKYGDKSWEKGLPISDLVNHALRHWRLYASGDRSEDHLSKAAWGFMAAKHSEVCWPHLNTDMRREGCIPPCVDDETAASWRKFKESMDGLRKEYRETEGKPDSEIPGTTQTLYQKVSNRFHFMADPDERMRMAQYRTDLVWEGHEVVTRWIDDPFSLDMEWCDTQSCDTCIVFAKDKFGGLPHIDKAIHFGKKVVVIGEYPEGCLAAIGGLWFPAWEDFMRDLSSSRTARREAPSSR